MAWRLRPVPGRELSISLIGVGRIRGRRGRRRITGGLSTGARRLYTNVAARGARATYRLGARCVSVRGKFSRE